MAFSYSVTDSSIFGNKKIKMGTYNAASVTTGDVDTGLDSVDFFSLQSNAGATPGYATVSGGTLSLTTASSDTGYWFAIGS